MFIAAAVFVAKKAESKAAPATSGTRSRREADAASVARRRAEHSEVSSH
jgi:hypothetical protein